MILNCSRVGIKGIARPPIHKLLNLLIIFGYFWYVFAGIKSLLPVKTVAGKAARIHSDQYTSVLV